MFAAVKTLYLNWIDLSHADEIGFDLAQHTSTREEHLTVVEFKTVEERASWQAKFKNAVWGIPTAEVKA